MRNKLNNLQGFTLIELLIVVAILAIIVVLILVAINPSKQTREARNNTRLADVLVILNAVDQYKQTNGEYPTELPAPGDQAKMIGSGENQADICSFIVPDIIPSLPMDPSTGVSNTGCGDYNTLYSIERSSDGGKVTVSAPESLNDGVETEISATR